MDRMLYVAMTGAKETLRAQTVNNHNLANVSTTGFRADLAAFQSRAVDGTGFDSRVYATNASVGWDDTSGALEGANVDVTEQLVQMITAQRNFQANAQMISTADQITQTIINMR